MAEYARGALVKKPQNFALYGFSHPGFRTLRICALSAFAFWLLRYVCRKKPLNDHLVSPFFLSSGIA